MATKHSCHRCAVHEVQGPFLQQGVDGAPELESLDTTFAEDGQEIFFATGYSARELQGELLDKTGVATIAGTSFGAFGEDYLRFSYASSVEAIIEAIERIRQFLGNLPRKK